MADGIQIVVFREITKLVTRLGHLRSLFGTTFNPFAKWFSETITSTSHYNYDCTSMSVDCQIKFSFYLVTLKINIKSLVNISTISTGNSTGMWLGLNMGLIHPNMPQNYPPVDFVIL